MAQTYTHTPVLSKVKVGESTYYLKDADVRAILDTFGNIVTENKAVSITNGATGIPDADQVYDFVVQQIGAIGSALNLKAEADHDNVENPAAGDFVVETDGSEWLYDGTGWREVGSENAYVKKTFTIANIDMQDNITKAELQQALELKALAYKDNGKVTVETPDSINAFSTGKAGEYAVTASAVSVPATYNSLDVTPAGSVEITAGTAAAATYDKTNAVGITTAAASGAGNYTPTGSVSIDGITVTPSKANVATVTDSGTSYTLTEGSAVKAADTKAQFAQDGVIAEIGTGDDAETLILSTATKADAVTAAGAITYTAPTLSGSLPTFGTASVVNGITSATGSATFTGNAVDISATPTYAATAATVTQPTFTAEFTGTSKSVTPTAATTVSAAGTDGTVTVASEDITPTMAKSNKEINVVFGVNS